MLLFKLWGNIPQLNKDSNREAFILIPLTGSHEFHYQKWTFYFYFI